MGVALSLLATMAALADADRVQLSVERAALASSCPDHRALAEQVRQHLGSEPFVMDAAGAHRRVDVLMFASPRADDELVVRVRLTDAAGLQLGQRELRGALDCATLSEELTLAVAIAIDPLLLLRPPARDAGEDGAEVSQLPAPEQQAAPADQGEYSPPPRHPMPHSPSARAERGLGAQATAWSVHAALLGSSGLTAPLAPGLRAGVGVDHRALFAALDVRAAAPARWVFGDLAGSVDARTLTLQAAAGGVLSGYAARLRGALVCEGGALVATGVRLAEVREAVAPWVAVGARGGLEIELTRGVALTVDLEAVAPLLRPRYVDGRTGELIDAGRPVVWSGGLGVALAPW